MALAFLAILTIVAGGLVRMMAPRNKALAGRGKLLGYGLMVAGIGLGFLNMIVVIQVGEVGVKHFLGNIDDTPLKEGVHIVNPLADIEKMSIRDQSFPADGGVEDITAQTSEQLDVELEVSILFRIDSDKAPHLYQSVGSENEMKRQILLSAVRNGVRDAIATKSINEIFSPDRREIAEAIEKAIEAKAEGRVELREVFVRDVKAPQRVRDAIEEKLQREQQVAAERFQTEIIEERARQQVEEAKGIAAAQRIISEGLTPAYLTFFYIESLKEMPEGSVIYVPTEGGIPLIRPLEGGRR